MKFSWDLRTLRRRNDGEGPTLGEIIIYAITSEIWAKAKGSFELFSIALCLSECGTFHGLTRESGIALHACLSRGNVNLMPDEYGVSADDLKWAIELVRDYFRIEEL